MPREPSQVDGSEMDGRASKTLVQQIDNGYIASCRLFGSLKRFPDARGKYAREKRRDKARINSTDANNL